MKKHSMMSLAADALAVSMVGLAAGGAQAATYRYPGASLSWTADGDALTVRDTKSDGRYIYPMGQYKGTADYLTALQHQGQEQSDL